jgi:primary-amine oxidase
VFNDGEFWTDEDRQITMEDLQAVEHICRKDPKVIEQCEISGIPKEDMHKVYCDRMSSLLLTVARIC